MHLNTLRSDPRQGFCADRSCEGGGRTQVITAGINDVDRVVGSGARELEASLHVCHSVLYRLKGSDRPAELFAHLDVLVGQTHGVRGSSQLLHGDSNGSPIQNSFEIARSVALKGDLFAAH